MDAEMYCVTIEGHWLYGSIGSGLKTPIKSLAIITAEGLYLRQHPDEGIYVWELDQGMGGLNSWACIGQYKDGRWLKREF